MQNESTEHDDVYRDLEADKNESQQDEAET